ncbi:probable G-protein coupled receptor 139 [Mobula hypostoma]|uniref:probable G-protein coupled receptor 139 n=1 Tax=Mobula hypostoma TaxID=723540 RepID=UPI002FC2A430
MHGMFARILPEMESSGINRGWIDCGRFHGSLEMTEIFEDHIKLTGAVQNRDSCPELSPVVYDCGSHCFLNLVTLMQFLLCQVVVAILPQTGANLVAIVILSRGKCGLSKCITLYLVGMAAADLLVVISNPLLKWTAEIYFPRSFLFITAVCRLVRWLMFASTATSVWLTVAFTVDRFVAICCEKLKTKYCTERTAAVVIGTVSVLACLETVPWGFVYGAGKTIDGVSWYCVLTPSFTNSPSWAAFEIFHRIFYPCVPFILMLLFNILTVRRILAASRARRGLRGQKSGENDKDREMENRRKSIVLLFSITGSFILLWGTLVVFSIYRRITNSYVRSVTDPRYVTDQTSTMLQVLSSCTNTCIYVLTQSKFREELKNAVKYPLNLILKLMKR